MIFSDLAFCPRKVLGLIFALVFGLVIPVLGYASNTFSYGVLILALLPAVLGCIRWTKKIIYIVIFLECVLLVQVYFTIGLNEKSIYSSIVLIYSAVTFYLAGDLCQKKELCFDFYFCVCVLLAIFFVGAVSGVFGVATGYNILYKELPKPCFPFQEPSQLALFGGPLLIGLLPFAGGLSRFVVFVILFLLGLTLQSATFLAFSLVSLFLIFSNRSWLILMFIIVVAVALALGVDFFYSDSYFYKRIYGVATGLTYNRSVLVYLQGWESVKYVFENAYLGLGFQSLGMEPPNKYSRLINGFFGEASVNRQDGGFLFAKIFSEFGFVFVAIFICYVALMIREVHSIGPCYSKEIKSSLCVYMSLLVPLFLRDVGYFSFTIIYLFFSSGRLWGQILTLRHSAYPERLPTLSE